MMINCVVIDDEPPAIRQMEEYISRVEYLNLLASFENPVDSLSFLKKNKVDLIFLDINMEELTGIQFLKLLKDKPMIILTTAFDSYALEAFDLDVDDYLLKPISFERFIKAGEKIYNKLFTSNLKPDPGKEVSTKERDYFFVKSEFRVQKIDFDDILYIEGMKEYLRIVLTNEKIFTKQSFAEIMKSLPSECFIRVHKSYIISLSKICSIRKNQILIGDKAIPIGGTYRAALFSIINNIS